MSETALSRTVRITNRRGLHARASAKFVTLASGLSATILVSKVGHDQQVVGTSIMGLMMLGAAMGDDIVISCHGEGAEAALGAVTELVETRFGEE
jgi:phosphocarrier protein